MPDMPDVLRICQSVKHYIHIYNIFLMVFRRWRENDEIYYIYNIFFERRRREIFWYIIHIIYDFESYIIYEYGTLRF